MLLFVCEGGVRRWVYLSFSILTLVSLESALGKRISCKTPGTVFLTLNKVIHTKYHLFLGNSDSECVGRLSVFLTALSEVAMAIPPTVGARWGCTFRTWKGRCRQWEYVSHL